MATLTGTGAVNLTSSTNWSPAQIPAPGDDLIIGNATLTLDANFSANTVTFNNAASRLAFSGTTRTLTATNGFFVTANIGGNRLCQTDVATGLTLNIFGKWTISAGASDANVIANVTGGTLNLSTVGGVESNQLFEVNSGSRFSIFTQSSGTTNTTGIFNYSASSPLASAIATVNAGAWNHYSNGTNSFVSNNTSFNLFSFSGSGTSINLSGNWLSTSTIRFAVLSTFSGTITINGNVTFPLASPFMAMGSSALVIINGEIDVLSFSNSAVGILRWQNQSRTVAANKSLNLSLPVQIAGLIVENFGKILFGSGVVPDANTQIRMRNLAAQIFCSDANLDTRVLPFQTTAPTLPAVQNVAAGTVYGYAGLTQTGTGLILDPAVLASAVGSSLTPVSEQLDEIETTLGEIQAQTDTITPVDLTPVSEQLDEIETTLGEIQAQTDTITPVDLTPVSNQLDEIETTLGDIQAKTDTIEPPSTGPHRLTITATDDGDQLAGALVRILGVAGTLRTTEADAPSLIDLGPGDYTIRITPPALFDAPNDIPVTLPGPSGDVSIAIPLTRAAIIPPAAGNLCAVAVRIADPSDTPVASATVRAYLVTGPLLDDTIHTGKTTDTTNAAGLATLHLLRSQTYEIEAQIGGTLTTIRRTIPDAPNAVLSATFPA